MSTSRPSTFATLNRRYLRISQYSVLEVRIYLDLKHVPWFTWEIISEIRPLIIPKLREEATKKKKQSSKDVIKTDKFEATIFLLPIKTRHEILSKSKTLTFPPSRSDDEEDLNIKPTLNTKYDGYTIWGKSLCIIAKPPLESGRNNGLEDWIQATQAGPTGGDEII
ncbi:hypothetical protein NEOLI_003162 [Neolecta irregularis DAH-3]|uniref:Uncharacterized protein n=1 Tax=Neolecta irregularis (strain DAH-3) TaxID=1198029 RepID=A0A1U7LPR7_NEOID|nr:hypothetical protein NEOLI_003162 [Neolecta irregularis DAH-3]|eukprot:OLL24629.1 hypothetical protein NEOLI_003162 [Neolecta irregularis DAH-3]